MHRDIHNGNVRRNIHFREYGLADKIVVNELAVNGDNLYTYVSDPEPYKPPEWSIIKEWSAAQWRGLRVKFDEPEPSRPTVTREKKTDMSHQMIQMRRSGHFLKHKNLQN